MHNNRSDPTVLGIGISSPSHRQSAVHISVLIFRLSISPSTVNCSDPTSPVDGTIDPYQNTTEGAEIFFRCDPGFIPAGRMRAVCGADGRWAPYPATLACTCECSHTVAAFIVAVQ